MVTPRFIRESFKLYVLLGGALLALAASPAARGDLVALYNFEQEAGVPDSSGNGFDGSVDGTASYSSDVAAAIASRSTMAFSFNGATSIDLPHGDVDFYDRAQTTGASISMWVKANAQLTRYFFSVANTADNTPIYGLQASASASGSAIRRFYRDDNSNITEATTATAPLDGTWFHLAMTDFQGDVKVYIDGVEDATNFDYTPGTFSDSSTALGALVRITDGFWMTGLMDEVAIFDGVLSGGEVGQLASGTAPVTVAGSSSANLVALYEFEGAAQEIGDPATLNGTGFSYVNDAPSSIASRSTQSISLTGDSGSDFVSLPTDFNGDAQAGGATVSLWVKTASGVPSDYVFSVSSSTDNTPFYGIQGDPGDNSKPRFFYRNDAGTEVNATGTASVFGTGWHHLVLTNNGATARVYVDGAATPDIALALPGGALTVDNESLGVIDRPSPFGYLSGQFDEVAFYDRVLTAGEIGQLAAGLDPTAIPDEGPPVEPLRLSVTYGGTDLTFSWNSEAGMYYNLRASTDLATDVSTWDLVVGEIPGSAPLNSLTIPAPADPHRFYIVEETTFEPIFPLWSGDPIPSVTSIPFAPGLVDYTLLDAANPYPYKFLHGAAIINYDGEFYANWANSPVDENSADEILVGRRFTDAANSGTWSATEIIGSDLPGADRRSHAAYLEHEGQLWTFAARFGTGDPGTRFDGLRAEAFVLNETTDDWDSQGIVMTNCWPYEEPVLMSNGNYIVGGQSKDGLPVVAISHGDDLTQWDSVLIPYPAALAPSFAEVTVWAEGIQVTAVIRGGGGTAWATKSFDGGVTWQLARPSNLPMPRAKAYLGKLSTGQLYLLSNLSNRNTLVVSTGKPGEPTLSKMWRIRHGSSSPIPLFPGAAKAPQWSYPYGYEHNGNLYVVYSIGKENCGLTVIPISSLANP